jgi:mycofactocin system glycosyltransferase
VSYVPATVLVCRVDALRAVGGFDESLRYGEDVDLVWRLAAAGWRCRYEPSVVVRHRTRASLREWVGQRIQYGGSAAPLSRRHRGAVAPVRISGWSAVTWGAIAAGAVGKGLVVGVGTTLALVRKLHNVPPTECLRLAGLGHVFAGRLLLSTFLRAWWPVAAVLAVVSPRARRVLAVAAVAMAAADWQREKPDLDLVSYVALRRLDDVAYGTGVWLGAWRHRTAAPLLPVFANWPPR